jgi:hypothetical protein
MHAVLLVLLIEVALLGFHLSTYVCYSPTSDLDVKSESPKGGVTSPEPSTSSTLRLCDVGWESDGNQGES